jgi:hypothetical protein
MGVLKSFERQQAFTARTFGGPISIKASVDVGLQTSAKAPSAGGISLPKQFRDLGGGLVAGDENWVAGISYKIVLGRARLLEAAEKTPILGGAALSALR